MPAAHIVIAALLLTTANVGAQQDPPAGKPPQKGEHVVVRGCLSGPVLESTETTVVDSTRALSSAITFRLTGDKNLLKRMRKEQDRKVVEVTGVLKSDLPQDDKRPGKQIGKTRIVVGIGSPQTMQQQGPPAMPVLEVKSYESLLASCGR